MQSLPEEYFAQFNPSDFSLSIGDVVEVSVFGFQDTIIETPIAPDGKLYYMFGDGIAAAGRKPEEVAQDIQSRLGKLFNNPQVDILPKSFSAQRFLVLGKVNHPGLYPLDSALTLRQAIARAGGLSQGIYRGSTIEIALLSDSYILRNGQRLPVDFEALINGSNVRQDIYIRPGDVIYIASGLSRTREVYLMGAVSEQKAVAFRDNMTIIELVAGASDRGGGYLPDANLSRVIIVRGALQDPQPVEVNLKAILQGNEPDVYLLAGDVVYVPSKPFKFARDLSKSIVLTFVKTFASEAGSAWVQETFFPESTGSTTIIYSNDEPTSEPPPFEGEP